MNKNDNNAANENTIYLSKEWKNGAGQAPMAFNFIQDFIYFLILLPVMLCIMRVINSNATVYYSIAILPVYFWLLAASRLIPKKLGISILLTLLLTAIAIILFLMLGNYLAAAFSVIALIVSLLKQYRTYLRRQVDLDAHNLDSGNVYMKTSIIFLCVIVCFSSYLFSLYRGYGDLTIFCFADIAVMFTLILIYKQRSGAYCLSQWNKREEKDGNTSSGENSGGSGKVSGAIFTFWAIIGTAIISVIVFLIAKIGGLVRIDYIIMNIIANLLNTRQKILIESATSNILDASKKAVKEKVQKSTSHAQPIPMILQILCWLLIFAAVLFAIFFISRAIIYFCRRLGSDISEERHSLFSVDDAVNSVKEQVQRIGRSLNIFSRGSNRMAIRRLFFSHVKKHVASSVKSSDAPFEISGKITERSGHDLTCASQLYEKARYSNDECDADDVKRMKKSL